jgi:hypothetical protein
MTLSLFKRKVSCNSFTSVKERWSFKNKDKPVIISSISNPNAVIKLQSVY